MKRPLWEESPGALAALLESVRAGGANFARAHLYTFELADGQTLRFTDADRDIYGAIPAVLDLDLVDQRVWDSGEAVAVDDALTCVRSGQASIINADGQVEDVAVDTVRFEYVITDVRTNFAYPSSGPWTGNANSTPAPLTNQGATPDGGTAWMYAVGSINYVQTNYVVAQYSNYILRFKAKALAAGAIVTSGSIGVYPNPIFAGTIYTFDTATPGAGWTASAPDADGWVTLSRALATGASTVMVVRIETHANTNGKVLFGSLNLIFATADGDDILTTTEPRTLIETERAGVLIEPDSYNYQPNSGGVNAGAIPANWAIAQNCGGLAPDTFLHGTDIFGYGYVQFRVHGTTTLTNRLLVNLYYPPASTLGVPVVAGQIVTVSYNLAIAAGNFIGGSGVVRNQLIWRNSAGVAISSDYGDDRTPTSEPLRDSVTATAPAGAVYCQSRLDFQGPDQVGLVVDFYPRLGGVNFETIQWSPTIWAGANGAGVYPTGWQVAGISSGHIEVAGPETVDTFPGKIVKIRLNAAGYQGLQTNAWSVAVDVSYKVSVDVRIPTGVTATDLAIYTNFDVAIIATAATLNAQAKDVWVRYDITFIPTANSTFVALISTGGTAGKGFDLAIPSLQTLATLQYCDQPGSYIHTTTVPLARGADKVIGPSSGYNPDGVTIYGEVSLATLATTSTTYFQSVFSYSVGDGQFNRLQLDSNSLAQWRFGGESNSVVPAFALNNQFGVKEIGTTALAMSIAEDNAIAVQDGEVAAVVTNSGKLPDFTPDRSYIGSTYNGGSGYLRGHVRRIIAFDENLPPYGVTYMTENPPAFPAYGLALWEKDLVVDAGSSRSTAHWKKGLDVDTWLVVVAPRPEDPVTGEEFPDKIGDVPWVQAAAQGALDGAQVTVDRAYFAGWPQPWTAAVTPVGILRMFAGEPGAVDVGDITVSISINDMRQKLLVETPTKVYQAGCRHTLFDAGCTLDAEDFAVATAAIGGSTRAVLKSNVAAPGGSGTYTLGRVRMTSGLNAGFVRTVRHWAAGSFSLLVPFPFDVVAGDTFNAYPGCDKALTTCALFANSANFGGEPFIPAAEAAL